MDTALLNTFKRCESRGTRFGPRRLEGLSSNSEIDRTKHVAASIRFYAHPCDLDALVSSKSTPLTVIQSQHNGISRCGYRAGI